PRLRAQHPRVSDRVRHRRRPRDAHEDCERVARGRVRRHRSRGDREGVRVGDLELLMSLSDEARDPWTYVLGGLAAGVAWAVSVPVAAAIGVGAAVAGVKAVVGGALGGRRASGRREPLPVKGKTPEDGWLKRGERAVASFDALSSSVPEGM